MAYRLISLLIGYAFGCIPTAYIVGYLKERIDIREHGSGNMGTTNTIRVLGFSMGAIVFACDFLKSFLAFVTAANIFRAYGGVIPPLPGLYAGLGAVLGHNFPFFMKFKGGRGIASTLGILLVLDWRAALVAYLVMALVIFISRYMSLASLVMALTLPFLFGFFGLGMEVTIIGAALTAMAFLRHRDNIGRLVKGTEPKLSFKKKKAS